MWRESSASGVAGFFVFGQIARAFGCVVALITGEGSVITVDAFVCGQITLVFSLIWALITLMHHPVMGYTYSTSIIQLMSQRANVLGSCELETHTG